MPKVNIYMKSVLTGYQQDLLEQALRDILSKVLTVPTVRELSKKDFSFRVFDSQYRLSHDFEIEVPAHAYPERVKKEDELSEDVISFLKPYQLRFEKFIDDKITYDVTINLSQVSYASSK